MTLLFYMQRIKTSFKTRLIVKFNCLAEYIVEYVNNVTLLFYMQLTKTSFKTRLIVKLNCLAEYIVEYVNNVTTLLLKGPAKG